MIFQVAAGLFLILPLQLSQDEPENGYRVHHLGDEREVLLGMDGVTVKGDAGSELKTMRRGFPVEVD
jgi:hypothetical protein